MQCFTLFFELHFFSMKQPGASGRCQRSVWRCSHHFQTFSARIRWNWPFPAFQERLAQLPIGRYADRLRPVLHRDAEKWHGSGWRSNATPNVTSDTRNTDVQLETYCNSTLSHPGCFSQTLKSVMLPLTKLILLSHLHRPIKSRAIGKKRKRRRFKNWTACRCATGKEKSSVTAKCKFLFGGY